MNKREFKNMGKDKAHSYAYTVTKKRNIIYFTHFIFYQIGVAVPCPLKAFSLAQRVRFTIILHTHIHIVHWNKAAKKTKREKNWLRVWNTKQWGQKKIGNIFQICIYKCVFYFQPPIACFDFLFLFFLVFCVPRHKVPYGFIRPHTYVDC